MTFSLNALCASKGVAIGKLYIVDPAQLEVSEFRLDESSIEAEVKRFHNAIRKARKQLKEIRSRIPESATDEIASFIDTHLLMLQDSAITRAPAQLIRERACNAEWALKLQRDELVSIFNEMEDPYLRTRRDDVDHVVMRIQRILLHLETGREKREDVSLNGYIALADDLTAADIVLLHHQGIAGFITEYGGTTSHTAILARSLRLPAIVGLHQARSLLHDEDEVIIDGRGGLLLVDPDKRITRHYTRLRREITRHHAARKKLTGKSAKTRNGVEITLHANIELPEDVKEVRKVKAEGVGLLRTEFLFMNRDELPSEEEQFKAYSAVVKAMKGSPVTIRTLDIGADKPLRTKETGYHCANPALGMRAIRMCLANLNMFRPQLRAILRASAFGQVRMMVPMLSSMHELNQVSNILDEEKQALQEQGIKFDEKMPVGAMIEVPAAALCADAFARHLDFLSIGTNDLIQYVIAADRVDDEVNYLYDPLHPAVLKLIQMSLDAARKAQIPVSMCGDMAADAQFTRLLLGMGLREFSVPPNALLEIKQIINDSDTDFLGPWIHRIIRTHDVRQQFDMVQEMNGFRETVIQ